LQERLFQLLQKPRDGEREIVAHQEQRLQCHAVALPQCFPQRGLRFAVVNVQPLLELVDDEQQLRFAGPRPLLPYADGQVVQAQCVVAVGNLACQAPPQAVLEVGRAGIDDDRLNSLVEPRNDASPQQRGLAAATGTEQHTHAKCIGRIGRCNPSLPKTNALGHAVPIASAGQ
jgi:hypothetical protein